MDIKLPKKGSITALDSNLGGQPPPDPDALDFLLTHYGIDKNYIDYSGNVISIPFEYRLKVLSFFDIDTNDAKAVNSAVSRIKESSYFSLVPAVTVTHASPSNEASDQKINDNKNVIAINIPTQYLNDLLRWEIILENGEPLSQSFKAIDLIEKESIDFDSKEHVFFPSQKNKPAITISQRELPLPPLPCGYHSLKVEKDEHNEESETNTNDPAINLFLNDTNTLCSIISSPSKCYEPQWLIDHQKLKGLSIQVYSLVSENSWGMGDFSDLKELISHSSKHQIDFIVLNPLHYLDADNPDHCSPYSPMDRRFINPLYIDPIIEPDFIEYEETHHFLSKKSVIKSIASAKDNTYIDYQTISTLKYDLFSKMFSSFKKNHLKKNTERAKHFANYTEKKGLSSLTFAEHQAQKSHLSLKQTRDPKFHLYLQWLAETQLEDCQKLTASCGMAVGLIRDLAVGGDGKSTEVELNKNLFCTKASIGAPPDPLAPQGQNWGLPPLKPHTLKQTGYAHFIDLLYTNMIHCGALRIDHVMALMRLWWCPNQDHNGEGAYVHYPVDELFAILRLESQRNQCMVIGEDLGVVPPEIHEHMSRSAVFSNVLFYFEKYDHLHFKKPEHIAEKSLSMIANHDVPTLTAWWNKSDLALRKDIGLYKTEEDFENTLRERESDLIQILHWLNEQGLLPESWQDFNIHRHFNRDLLNAILTANSRSSAQLVSIQVDDLCLTELPVNIPGTCDEYPNWRRRLPKTTDDIFTKENIIHSLQLFTGT